MFKFLRPFIGILIDTVLIPYAARKWFVTNTDKQRAETGEIIARAAAAQVLAEYPDEDWAQLVQFIVTRIGDQLPPAAARRAAAGALREAGAFPPARL